VMESEGVGDDGGGDLKDELAQGKDARGAQRQAVVAELPGHGAVGGGLADVAAGEQQVAAVVGGDVAAGRRAASGTRRRGAGPGWPYQWRSGSRSNRRCWVMT